MFDKNKKKEKEVNVEQPAITELEPLVETSYSCSFARDGDRVVLERIPITRVFNDRTQKWKKSKGKPELLDISTLGWVKSLKSKIIVRREVTDIDSMTGTKEYYYVQTLHYKVLDRYKWVYLKRENNRVYIKDFMNGGVCFECPKNSSSYVDVVKDEGKRISQKEALAMAQNGLVDGFFSKITQDGNQTYYHQKVLTRDQKHA